MPCVPRLIRLKQYDPPHRPAGRANASRRSVQRARDVLDWHPRFGAGIWRSTFGRIDPVAGGNSFPTVFVSLH